MAAQIKCDQMVALKLDCMNNSEVVKQLNICKETVFNVWKTIAYVPLVSVLATSKKRNRAPSSKTLTFA